MLGFPALAAPVVKSALTSMPQGVGQLVAAPFNEALLIVTGKELERAFGGWVQPGEWAADRPLWPEANGQGNDDDQWINNGYPGTQLKS